MRLIPFANLCICIDYDFLDGGGFCSYDITLTLYAHDFAQLYEAFKAHALARTNLDDKEALGKMVACAIKITPDDALSKQKTTTCIYCFTSALKCILIFSSLVILYALKF